MAGWVAWAYLTGAVLLVWPITQFLLRVDQGPWEEDSEDRFWAAVFAVFIAALWPLFLGGAGAFYLSRRFWRAVLGDRSPTPDPEGSRHA